jgi:hypothetical protein
MAGANNPIAFKGENLCSPGVNAGCCLLRDGNGTILRLTAGARCNLAPSNARPNLFSGD